MSVEARGDRSGEDVPEVEGDDVGGEEFDLVFREGFDLGWGILGLKTLG